MGRKIFRDLESPTVTVDLQAVLRQKNEKRRQDVLAQKGVYPLSAPGLPPLQPKSALFTYAEAISAADPLPVESDFAARLEQCRERIEYTVAQVLWTQSFSAQVPIAAFQSLPAQFIPGVHVATLTSPRSIGPAPADVMVINKIPSYADKKEKQSCCGRDMKLLEDHLNRFPELKNCSFYFTNLLKFVPPDKKNRITVGWKKDGLFLLMQEIMLVRPRYILCLGAEVARTLLNTAAAKVVEAHTEPFLYDIRFDGSVELPKAEATLMVIPHPSQVSRDPSAERQIESCLTRFAGIYSGRYTADEGRLERFEIDNPQSLLEVLKRAEQDPLKEDTVVAVDAEWHGEHPTNEGSYVRTVQFSWLPGRAAAIKFCEKGGEVTPAFVGGNSRGLWQPMIDLLAAYFLGGTVEFLGETVSFRPKRIVGQFFNADLEWLIEYGLDLRPGFACPVYDLRLDDKVDKELRQQYMADGFRPGDIVPAWYRTKYEGGADTGLMAHAIEETGSYRLEDLAIRYTSAPCYNVELLRWKNAYCTEHKLQTSALEGYGECPDEILIPYGMWDADVTLRLFYRFAALLDHDHHGKSCREAFWESQIAAPAVLEIHRTGLVFDQQRFDYLVDLFADAQAKLLASLREILAWPDFNPRSAIHVKEMLFGEEYNGQISPLTHEVVRVRPPGARSMKLRPVCDTSKPPRPWKEVVEAKETHLASVSANQKVISSLYHKLPAGAKKTVLGLLRDYRFMSQALSTTLRPPVVDKKTAEVLVDDDGDPIYEKGLASYVCGDGRVRTHIYQTKETGRWSSARPNLQNISKKRDEDYQRILGKENYTYSIRGVFRALPGHVLIEADFVGAELYGMALLSGDELMIEHAKRNTLPEEHPDYYDIHSNIAVLAFKLQCPPTKTGLKDIGKKHLRIVAKSVVFGFAYGRGAKAIAVAAEEEGIDLTVEEAKAVIDAISNSYPRLAAFFEECRARATGTFIDPVTAQPAPRIITNAFGRHRRFPVVRDEDSAQGREAQRRLLGEYGRQAMNFPVQSLVASVVSRAAAYLAAFKQRPGIPEDLFQITLQIHDALIFQVPYRYVQYFCEQVLPYCMRQRVPIWPAGLDGRPLDAGPYYLGLDAEVMEYWGERIPPARAQELGLPTGDFNGDGCIVHYTK